MSSVLSATMNAPDRLISPIAGSEDASLDRAVRPKRLADYIGQQPLREQMDLFIRAARARSEALDHVLLFGPPGLGKTTLAHITVSYTHLDVYKRQGWGQLRPAGRLASTT